MLGEAPTWWPEKSLLCWIDVRGKRVRVLNLVSGVIFDVPTPELPGGMCLTDRDRLLVAMEHHLALLDLDAGRWEELAPPPHAAERTRFNELRADPEGRVFVGYMNDATRTGGCLYRLTAGGYEVAYQPVDVPNSLAWSPDGATMYFADGIDPVIWAFDYAAGQLGTRREFARVRGGVPDGAAVDIAGGLWSAVYGAGQLIRFAADGSVTHVVEMPATQPTCPVFAGATRTLLYCASAKQNLDQAALAGQPLAGEVFVLRAETPGLDWPRAKEEWLPR
jgi:sugar lactone lactonase YvrE